MVGCVLVPRFPLACEQVEHPELIGRPAAVVAEGKVWAASEAAERSGIRPQQPLREALNRCPLLIVREARPAYYQVLAEALLASLEMVAFTVEPGEPGEAYVGLGELRNLYPSMGEVAGAILRCAPALLLQNGGLRVGIAPARFPARVAAHQAQPGSIFMVEPSEQARFLARQPVTTLPVSAEMQRRLELLSITTLGELAALPRSALAAQFGRQGALAWELAHSQEHEPLRPRPRSGVVCEHLVLEAPLVSAQAVLLAWDQTLTRALRQPAMVGKATRQARLYMATERAQGWERTVTFKEALSTRDPLWTSLRPVLEMAQPPGPVTELSLELTRLVVAQGEQLALPTVRGRLKTRLEEALRQLKARYGYCPVGRVVEVEPWNRIPERRRALIDFDP
jgi:nucleotidyltransferase/DNA polymerase involved in DNA repair